ncbi:hypothetical protein [Huintestinicola sp.]|uniref:hypothetical protein n=1 Tax=Huintestinicola sp. TaxID=2981661 RepID=UPI003D7F01C0
MYTCTNFKNEYIIVDLGTEYAGRTVTIYKGRKSTKKEVAEGVLDKNGKSIFENTGFGSNFTLIVGDQVYDRLIICSTAEILIFLRCCFLFGY